MFLVKKEYCVLLSSRANLCPVGKGKDMIRTEKAIASTFDFDT